MRQKRILVTRKLTSASVYETLEKSFSQTFKFLESSFEKVFFHTAARKREKSKQRLFIFSRRKSEYDLNKQKVFGAENEDDDDNGDDDDDDDDDDNGVDDENDFR